jgi:hypothetical protein
VCREGAEDAMVPLECVNDTVSGSRTERVSLLFAVWYTYSS